MYASLLFCFLLVVPLRAARSMKEQKKLTLDVSIQTTRHGPKSPFSVLSHSAPWACFRLLAVWVLGMPSTHDLPNILTRIRRLTPCFAYCSGTENTALSDTANGVLYGVFAIAGLFAGSVNVSR